MHVVLLAALSLDGRLTRGDRPGDAFVSDADRSHFRAEMSTCDACVMGRRTYDASRQRLRPDLRPDLRRVVWTRSPEAHASDAIPRALEFSAEAPAALHTRLAADGRRRCALLGGAELNTAWLDAGLVDEICITLESWIFGGGVSLAPGIETSLELREVRPLTPNGPVLLRYSVKK